ncbi:sulfatase-like hydrolase/transferase [Hyphomicrobium sp. 2TAF46]|uniref:sulfatase-like hydrolase/transferase n=1 Tax=Hyphomicrobium sp. 2TAF46 TaxID=3233019 RepID=UPI003F912E75
MADTREYSRNPSRRDVVGAGGALFGVNFLSSPADATLAQLKLPDKAPETPPPGYNILFVLVDQEHFFKKWPFPVPGREYLKTNGTTFLNHQGASQVCSSARSVIYTGQHIQHTGVFDNMEAPWQRDMSVEMVTIGHRLQQLGYHAAYQGKWHLSGTLDTARKPVDAPLLQYRDAIEKYGFADFLGLGDLIDGPIGGYRYDSFATNSAVTWLKSTARELKAKSQPWFMAVNLVNPHDVMYVNSDAPGETVQGKYAAYPIDRPPRNDIYLAEWDVPLPATRIQPLDAPGRPRAHYEYQATQDILLGQWPNEDSRWRILQNYYFNCIRDCDDHLVRLLDEVKANGLEDSTIVIFTADHGELGGAHQMRGKGANAYKEQQHLPLMILHPAYPGGRSTKAISSQIDLAPTLLGLTGKPFDAVARAGTGLPGRDLSKLLSSPEQASTTAVRPAALYNYNMFSYLDAKWFAPLIRVVVSNEPMVEKVEKLVRLQPDFNNRGAIRSIFDGRYRFSRYFSPIHFNRPTTYEALVTNNDLEVYDLQEDPEETRNLAQDGTAKGELMMALNDKLNARIDEEVGDDNGKFLPLIDGYWFPARA